MAKKDFKDWKLDDIIAYCQANGKVDWLKTTANKKVTHSVYPKVEHISKTGKRTMVSDKKAAPISTVERTITFVELKSEFVATFFPESIKGKKENKPSFIDRINAL